MNEQTGEQTHAQETGLGEAAPTGMEASLADLAQIPQPQRDLLVKLLNATEIPLSHVQVCWAEITPDIVKQPWLLPCPPMFSGSLYVMRDGIIGDLAQRPNVIAAAKALGFTEPVAGQGLHWPPSAVATRFRQVTKRIIPQATTHAPSYAAPGLGAFDTIPYGTQSYQQFQALEADAVLNALKGWYIDVTGKFDNGHTATYLATPATSANPANGNALFAQFDPTTTTMIVDADASDRVAKGTAVNITVTSDSGRMFAEAAVGGPAAVIAPLAAVPTQQQAPAAATTEKSSAWPWVIGGAVVAGATVLLQPWKWFK